MSNFKKFLILTGDILMLYAALVATLLIRYRANDFQIHFNNHLKPFSIIFIVWILIFYINDLYKDTFLKINYPSVQKFLFSIFTCAIISIILFYLFTSLFELTPKTNLFLFAAIFTILDLGWRFFLAKIYIAGGIRNRLLVIGESPVTSEILNYLNNNPQLGYDIVSHIKDFSEIQNISRFCAEKNINTAIIQPRFKKNPEIAKIIYKLLASKISISDPINFYEMIFQKLAFEEMDENWFIEKISPRRPAYDYIKRLLDTALSLILIIVLLPLMLLISILVKINSKGPAIYKNERTGINDISFILYKFRIMIADHNGPLVTGKNDPRLTFIGKILNYTHLNEIPQLFNILKGDMSFIGPRPETSKLVEIYKQLPYYDLRHIIKPGLTGWAQVNYKPSSTLEEANEKLRYDIYYIKNRSLALDFLILLKTVKYLFMSLK